MMLDNHLDPKPQSAKGYVLLFFVFVCLFVFALLFMFVYSLSLLFTALKYRCTCIRVYLPPVASLTPTR